MINYSHKYLIVSKRRPKSISLIKGNGKHFNKKSSNLPRSCKVVRFSNLMGEPSQVTDENLREVEKLLAAEMYAKVESFGVNEFVNMENFDITPISSKSQDTERKQFFTRFDAVSLPFSPRFTSAEIAEKLKKVPHPETLLQCFNREAERAQIIKDVVVERLNDRLIYPQNITRMSHFLERVTHHLRVCHESAMVIGTETKSDNIPEKIHEMALVLELMEERRTFTMKRWIDTMRNMDLSKRETVIEGAVKRVASDLEKEKRYVPFVDNSPLVINGELERLSKLTGITCGLDEHDGQHFTYQCDMVFSSIKQKEVVFPKGHLNYSALELEGNDLVFIGMNFVDAANKNELMVEGVMNLSEIDPKYENTVFQMWNNKEMPREKVHALVELRYTRNKQLLIDVFALLKKICEAGGKSDEYQHNCQLLIKERVVAMGSMVMGPTVEGVDHELLIERCLDLEKRYLEAKLKVIEVLLLIHEHSRSSADKETIGEIVLKQPFISDKLCFMGFEAQIETLERIGKCLELMVHLQIEGERHFSSMFLGDTALSGFDSLGDIFEVFPTIEIIRNVLPASQGVIQRLENTLNIRKCVFIHYLENTVWNIFMCELRCHPERMIMVDGYEEMSVRLPKTSQSVESLRFCRFLDDIEFVKDFLGKVEESKRSRICKNLRKFVCLGWKLKKYLWLRNSLFPVYIRQKEDRNDLTPFENCWGISFDFSDIASIETLLQADIPPFEDIVTAQKRFLVGLEVALRFNNYRIDNNLIRSVFNLKDEDINLFITRSKHDSEDTNLMSPFLDFTASLFNSFEVFCQSDFTSLFCSLQESINWNDSQTILDYFLPYAQATELAGIENFTTACVSCFSTLGLFTVSEAPFWDANKQKLTAFAIAYPVECLSWHNDPNISKLLELSWARCNLIYQSTLDRCFSTSRVKWLEMMATGSLKWETTFLSKVHRACSDASVDQARDILAGYLLYTTNRLKMSVLALFEEGLTSQKKTSNFSFDVLKKFWSSLTCTNSSYLIGRYMPCFAYQYPYCLTTELRLAIDDKIESLNTKIETGFIQGPGETDFERTYGFVGKMVAHHVLKFAFMMLAEAWSYKELTVETVVTNMNAEIFKLGTPEYMNKVQLEGSQHVGPHTKKSGVEGAFLTAENAVLRCAVDAMLLQQQYKAMKANSTNLINRLSEAFAVSGSSLKPECYTKKNIPVAKRVVYVPSPNDADRQFAQETRYAKTKFMTMLHDIVNTSSKMDGTDRVVCESTLVEHLKPFSTAITEFLARSETPVIDTWAKYATTLDWVKDRVDNENKELSMLTNVILKRFERSIEVELGLTLHDKFLQLSSLRKTEKDILREQNIFEREVTKKIRQKYTDKLKRMVEEEHTLKKKFPMVWTAYFDASKRAIDKQMNRLVTLLDNIEPNMSFARASLEQSRLMDLELERIRQKEEGKEPPTPEPAPVSEEPTAGSSVLEPIPESLEEHKLEPIPESVEEESDSDLPQDKQETGNDHPVAEPDAQTSRRNPRRRRARKVELAESYSLISPTELVLDPNDQQPCDEVPEQPSWLPPGGGIAQSISALTGKELKELHNKQRANEAIEDKIERTKAEIKHLKKLILKERMTRCVMRIGTTKYHIPAIAKVAEEKKLSSQALWRGRRLFERETRETEKYLKEGYTDLSNAEAEIEKLKVELEEGKKVTTKLAHWKDVCMKTCDVIVKELQRLSNTGNVNVDKLLYKLQEKQSELDDLNAEHEYFEEQLEMEVHEPMRQCLATQRAMQKVIAQVNTMRKEAPPPTDDREEDVIQDMAARNNQLRAENDKIRVQIEELEAALHQIEPQRVAAVMPLFEPIERPAPVSYSYSFPRKVRKPAIPARGAFSKFKNKSMARPLIL